jgi:hypothetical protein
MGASSLERFGAVSDKLDHTTAHCLRDQAFLKDSFGQYDPIIISLCGYFATKAHTLISILGGPIGPEYRINSWTKANLFRLCALFVLVSHNSALK